MPAAARASLREAIYSGEVQFTSRKILKPSGQYDVVNWRWRAERCADLPPRIVRSILEEARAFDDREDYAGGTRLVDERCDELLSAHVGRAYDEDSVRAAAASGSRHAKTIKSLELRELWAREHELTPPEPQKNLPPAIDAEGRFRRLACERWWRRQVRKCWTRRSEEAMRSLGFISRVRAPYCSDEGVKHKAEQARETKAFLTRHALENEDGEQLSLLEVAARSNANPAIRRGELMVRARGFEEIADTLHHVGLFVTLTAPSAFHARHMSGLVNERWERKRVRDAQAWLCREWARARAKFKRLSVLVYGFRVAEPHHDGTPHWHLLLFTNKANAPIVRQVLRSYWLEEYSEEPGAKSARVKFVSIDPGEGTAAGYLAKYVAKNIDGEGSVADEGDEESGRPGDEAAQRVRAWASLHGIRQFQQVGGPPVGLWREARRVREPAEDPDIERACAAADAGDWARFVQAVGGIAAGRKTNMRLHREETGELNEYLEPRGPRTVGLSYASAIVITRPHFWRIVLCPPSQHSDSDSSRVYCSPSPPFQWASISDAARSPPMSATPPHRKRSRTRGYLRASARRSPPPGMPGEERVSQTDIIDSKGFFSSSAARPRGLGPVAITVRAKSSRLASPLDHNDGEGLVAAFLTLQALTNTMREGGS